MSQPAYFFVDAAKLVVDYLSEMVNVPVVTKIPNPRPPVFVLARRLGGVRQAYVCDSAQIGIECFAQADEDAHDLVQLVRGHLGALAGTTQGGTPVYEVLELAGPADLPDPLSDQSRYVCSVAIATRGTASTPSR
jgi:hypothetical protein